MPARTKIGPPVDNALNKWILYEKQIRRRIVNPLIRGLNRQLNQARQDYFSFYQILDSYQPDPNISNTANTIAGTYINKLSDEHKEEFTRKMSTAIGIDIRPYITSDFVQPIINHAISYNVDLINTIPTRLLTGLKTDLQKLAEVAPFDQQKVKEVVLKNGGKAGWNTRRITRDQTSKLIGNFNQVRQRQIGIEKYVWRTSQDERVRPTHEAKNDYTFRWDDPPLDTGNPGSEILCRCTGLAFIEYNNLLRQIGEKSGDPTQFRGTVPPVQLPDELSLL